MSLLELVVALSILSLVCGLIFSSLGPWLERTRLSSNEAAFWRAAEPAHLLISELTAGAIDPQSRMISADEVRFRLLATRLSMTPLDARLAIHASGGVWTLILETNENRAATTLLEAHEPLRFDTDHPDTLSVELQHNGRWAVLMSAPFLATAPIACEFDPISRTCRQ